MRPSPAQQCVAFLDNIVLRISWFGLSERFIRFGIVGTLGFCWDTGTVYVCRSFTNLYIAGIFGFFVAATANWAMNRLWTYRETEHIAPHIQWARFMAANSIGFIFNRGVYFALISKYFSIAAGTELFNHQPVIAIAAGSISGLCFNYFLSKRFVFS